MQCSSKLYNKEK